MGEFLTNYASEILSFLGGAIGGSLVTFRFTGRSWVTGGSSNVDQSAAQAGGDIVGRDKRNDGR